MYYANGQPAILHINLLVQRVNMFRPTPGKRLEIHTLKNYGPSALNLDNYHRPKTAIIGGVRRLRISSQSIKYWIRNSKIFQDFSEYAEKKYGATRLIRTRYILYQIRDVINDRLLLLDKDPMDYQDQLDELLPSLSLLFAEKKSTNEKNLTQSLTLSTGDIEGLADMILEIGPSHEIDLKSSKAIINDAKSTRLSSNTCAEMMLFGRFSTSKSQFLPNISTPMQVAHSVTCHEARVERDYWTTVDDLIDKYDGQGASHNGNRYFGAGVFNFYNCIDIPLLASNIKNGFVNISDEDQISLTIDLLSAYLYAVMCSPHKSNQTGFASYAEPDAVYLTYGSTFPTSAISTFECPVEKDPRGGYLKNSKACITNWIDQRYKNYGIFCGPDGYFNLDNNEDTDLETLVTQMVKETIPAIRLEIMS
jgi:CRISPR system Cascade subunit CasC